MKDELGREAGNVRLRRNRLVQLPGAGTFTALVILAEAGGITRFGSARKLAYRAGLTPAVRGPDRTVRHGHISRQGSARPRRILREAAQTAKRHPGYAASHAAIARRRGKKIAATAIARKLPARAWHLLTDAERAASAVAASSAPGTVKGAVTRREGPPGPGRARIFA